MRFRLAAVVLVACLAGCGGGGGGDGSGGGGGGAETVSTPTKPTGTTGGTTGTTYSYSAGGSTSSAGHTLEYRFDWGGGDYSNWVSSATDSKSWSSAGTKSVKAQARCASDTSVTSDWSTALAVDIFTFTTVGSLDFSGSLSPRGIYVSGNYAYIATINTAPHGLKIVDISNPAAPSLTGTYNTPSNAYGVHVSGSYAYVADGPAGLKVINVSNPALPTLVGSYDSSDDWATGIYVSGNYAYMAHSAPGLQIIRISDPTSPTLVTEKDTPGSASHVFVANSYAYVTDWQNDLQIIGW